MAYMFNKNGTTINPATSEDIASIITGTTAITESTPVAASVVVAAGPIATALAVNNTFVASCIIVAKAGNADNIMVGTSSSQIVPLAAGAAFSIITGQGRKTDLNDWFINGTVGQGVDILYTIVQ